MLKAPRSLCLCSPPPAPGFDVPIPLLGPAALGRTGGLYAAAFLGLRELCSLTTAAFDTSVVRLPLAAKVKSKLFWSSAVIPVLHASGVCWWLHDAPCLSRRLPQILGFNPLRYEGGSPPGGLLPSLLGRAQERRHSFLCLSTEPCLTMTGPGTVACPARGLASPMGTSCTSSMPLMMSGGKPGLSHPTARASRSGSSPARRGECQSAAAVTCGASWSSPGSVSPAALKVGSVQGGISLWSQPTWLSVAVPREGHPSCKLGLRADLPGVMFSKAGWDSR